MNATIKDNKTVKIKVTNNNANITVTPYEAQENPQNIDTLQEEVAKRWLNVNLIDILKESDLLVNFTQEMRTVGRSSAIDQKELRKRLLLCLYAIGSNTGLKRISIANKDAKYKDLYYTKKTIYQ